ncbi:MAG: bacillithiol biosynthesis deacetylase BshB1 [bacterium]|nr:bacillithiol biosynthesis deacetylase BshB1 [bacterium]
MLDKKDPISPYQLLPCKPVDIVVIGCHPDDIEVSMGGTIISLIKKNLKIGIIDLTDGEPTPDGTREIRSSECENATGILKPAFRVNLDLPNRYLNDTVENRKKLAEILRTARPRIIFTHYREDGHPDHSAAYHLVKAAKFYAKLTKTNMKGTPVIIPRLYYFISHHLLMHHNISFITPFDAQTFKEKLNALKSYKSQFPVNKKSKSIIKYLEHINGYLGFLSNSDYGEAFISEEPVVMADTLLLNQT